MEQQPQLIQLLKPRLNKYIKQEPLPHQAAFLLLDCKEAFLGGAAGPGKSSGLLMSALQYVDIPGYNAILIRNTYSNLSKPDGLIPRSHEWLSDTDAHWIGDKKLWLFPDGATLSFGYLDGPLDHFNYQSSAYQFIGFDEVVQIRENQFKYMFSRLRRLKEYSFVPSRVRSASNPPAPEQVAIGAWVKRRYIDPKTREKNAVFIPANMKDNPYLDTDDYDESLDKLDPITREQLKKGNWDIQARGRTFQREWFTIIDGVPEKVKKIRRWDLAASEPSKATKEPDWTVGVLMSRDYDGICYIEDIKRFRKKPGATEKIIKQTALLDGIGVEIIMEQEPGSSGKIVIDHYLRKVLAGFNFSGKRSTGSKYDLAQPFASQAEAGNVFLVNGRWIDPFLDEAELFPDGEFDDQIDCASKCFSDLVGYKIQPRLRVING